MKTVGLVVAALLGAGSVAWAGAEAEGELKAELPEIFAKAAAHYRALDAAATPLMQGGKDGPCVPYGFDRKARKLDMRPVVAISAGSFPGSLWYLYEATGDVHFRDRATAWTELFAPNVKVTGYHDVGQNVICTYGNARRLLKTDKYDGLLSEMAATLCRRFNQDLGFIRSWGPMDEKNAFLVVPDSVMTLELLEEVEKAGGISPEGVARAAKQALAVCGQWNFDSIARSHADATMRYLFRADGSCRHIVDFDVKTKCVRTVWRGQGADCMSAWSCGQSKSVYGYAMMYRMTKDVRYLDFAKKLADYAINHPNMPADGVPYWDYGAPGEERDSASAAILASALLELSQHVGAADGARYRAFAVKQLRTLSSSAYFSEGDEAGHFLLRHGVGRRSEGEVDTPLAYGDYYYLEALLRFSGLVKEDAERDLADELRDYVRLFRSQDVEYVTNAVSNADAEEFLVANVPYFACPDKDVERAWAYRWWSLRKHFFKSLGGWCVSEFTDQRAIACPVGHHLFEGRWLRDRTIYDDYTRYWFKPGANPLHGPGSYINWIVQGVLAREAVTGDRALADSLLDAFVANYEAWEKGWGARPWPAEGMYKMGLKDDGLFHDVDDREGTELTLSGNGARVHVNAMMYGEAKAIAKIAARNARKDVAAAFEARAARLERLVKERLWNERQDFFCTRNDDGTLTDVCELHGYSPWYAGMPLDEGPYANAWRWFADAKKGFAAPRGLTFPVQSAKGFKVSYEGHCCQWNGPSWPFATSVALTALNRALRSGAKLPVGRAEWREAFLKYARQHVQKKTDGTTEAWLDEVQDPYTGDWIAYRRWQRDTCRNYNHSTFCDLVITGLVGLRIADDGTVTAEPNVPDDWTWFRLENVPVRDRLVTVTYDRDGTRFGGAKGLSVELASATSPADAEAELKAKLPGIFAKAAAHYRALDAAATPLMKGKPVNKLENGDLYLPHGWLAWKGRAEYDMHSVYWWTAGHYPGTLWYLYEATGEKFFRDRATAWTEILAPIAKVENDHDVGFMMNCSYGNARRLLKTDRYDALLLKTATSLSTRFNPRLGLIRAWGPMTDKSEYTVIPDTMMNLEILEVAAEMEKVEKVGGISPEGVARAAKQALAVCGQWNFDSIARSHADVTMKNHFRPDGGCYHVLDYDQETGHVKTIRRGQGASCETAWSRGESWGIYGYAMMYRFTKDARYLAFSRKLADFAMNHPNMPKDGIPYWDYGRPGEERDSSAGAIMASGLLELSQLLGPAAGAPYRAFAVKQLLALSSPDYFSEGNEIGHFLLKHGTGFKPDNSEIDTPLNYGDYYYLEALLRFRRKGNCK